MKIKRFHAPDIRQAINLVREQLGPDAVILSNRKVDGGVEIVSAIDYDDSIFASPEAARQAAEQADTMPISAPVKRAPARATKAKQAEVMVPGIGGVDLSASRKWAEEYLQALQNSNPAPDKAKAEPISEKEGAPAPRLADEPIKGQPGLDEMRQELQSLRSLLEHQLSSLAWGDLARRYPERAKLMRGLLELGLTPELSRKVIAHVQQQPDTERAWRKALAAVAQLVPVVPNDPLDHGGVIALVGPTGVGKTTTAAKLAARFALRHGNKGIALITTDTYRIGAQEQLRTYGRILGVPVRVVEDADDLKKTLKGLYDKQLVLIDTAGMSQRDVRMMEQFSMLRRGSPLISTYLVLSANTQRPVLEEAVRAFKGAELAGCVITKLDEAVRLGGALSVVIENRLPVAYVSDGQRVPEDLSQARAVELVNRCVALTRQSEYRLESEEVEMAFGGLAANDHS